MKQLFKSISFFVTLILALLLLISVTPVFISPEKFHVLALLGFLFPVLWVINLLALILHILKRSIHLVIPLAVLLLTWNSWGNIFQLKGEQPPDDLQNPVRIMSFNTRMFDFYEWSELPDMPYAIYDFIEKADPDILCVQEFFTSRRKEGYSPNFLRARLRKMGYSHIEYRDYSGQHIGYGIATFSRYPVVNKGALDFSNSKNMAIFTDVNINGKVIRVFNNHLESIGFISHDFNVIDSLTFELDQKQKDGIREIVRKMSRAFRQRSSQAERISNHIKNSPYPVIVCGDFNDMPVSYVYRTMRNNLKDAFRESGSGFGGTYNGRLPSLRIDYIFHDPDINSYGFRRYKVDYSDHYPISTILEIQ
ncbi:endonuclease/exonuclease/phosphatase family protein [Anaerophaga thermohalophila]|uniref:endonuclease/exonuclease/phosphatase family protein n=1 Tax=Anaerophaga thermohalophila TaxID=177400 RepID=UPI000237C6DD|nr:endonuclease/exonuclease/phosphatase family protein [Anaerophaga thermohalophila]